MFVTMMLKWVLFKKILNPQNKRNSAEILAEVINHLESLSKD